MKTLENSTIENQQTEDPGKLARHLEALDLDAAARELAALPEEIAPAVVRYLSTALSSDLLQRLPYPSFRSIMDDLDSQHCASIFFHFPNHLRELLLLQLDEKKKKAVQEILTFPEDSAGRLMTKDYLVFTDEMLVSEVIDYLRKHAREKGEDSYLYVIDRSQKLTGILSMRDLVLAAPSTPLQNIMGKKVASVHSFMDRDSVVRELTSKNYFALPVVDGSGVLLGIVRARQILDDVQDGATEDLQQMFGAGGDERVFSSLKFSLKKRLPWLHLNLASAFMAAFVVGFFEDMIAQVTVLALFLPIVVDAGTGSQSMAVVMRGLVMREIQPEKVSRIVGKEFLLGAISGLVIGAVTGLISWFWKGNPFLGLVIALGMIINLAIAGFAGAAIPITLKRLGLDPAQCSTTILLTISDLTGLLAFFGLAHLFLPLLT